MSRIIAIFISLPVHEFAHGYCAKLLGDRTAEQRGRLTLNPLKHLDPIGVIAMLTVGFGWANPVPINTSNFNKPKRDMAIVALMGPISNLVLALIGFCLLKITSIVFIINSSQIWLYYFKVFFNYFAIINITLAVFNLIIVPPLDGSRLVTYFLPQKYYDVFMRFEYLGTIVVFVLLFFGFLDMPIIVVSECFLKVFDWITYPLDIFGNFVINVVI